MFEVTISGIRCRLSLLFPAVLLYMLYIDPSGLVLFGFLASCIHEAGHISAALLLECPPMELTFSCFGMRMVTKPSVDSSLLQDVIITLAGPLTNMAASTVLYFLSVNPLYSHIHLAIGILNLLPIVPLDGGRVIAILCERYSCPKRQKHLEKAMFIVTICPLICLGIMLAVQPSHNITLLVVTVYLIFMRLFYNGN